ASDLDQHQHRGHGTQTGEQDQRRAVDQGGNDQDGGDGVDGDLHHLQIALDGPARGGGTPLVDVVDDIQHRAQGQGQGEDDETGADVLGDRDRGLGQPRHGLHAAGDDQRRHHVGQAADQAEILEGAGLEQRVEATHQDALDQPVGGGGDQQQDDAGNQ